MGFVFLLVILAAFVWVLAKLGVFSLLGTLLKWSFYTLLICIAFVAISTAVGVPLESHPPQHTEQQK
tara:strand:- start:3507 stop:3707 length:201 start_codon:yes stop_codon:yes gene_type:complete